MLSCLCVLLLAASALGQLVEATLDELWEQFKIEYNKKYKSPEEEKCRRAIWEETLRFIETHNREEALGKHSYTVGMNHMGDLKAGERRKPGRCIPEDIIMPTHVTTV